MEMQGSRALAITQQQAWDALNDPAVLKTCIPGCDKVDATGGNQYAVGVSVKIGPVAAKFNGKITLSDINPPNSYTITFDGQGGAFASTSVKVAVSGDPGVEAYAAVDATRMTVALASETGGDTQVTVSLGNFEAGATATLYGNQGGATIHKLSSPTVDGGAVSFTLPGSSIAMLVIDGKNPNDLPDGGAGSGGAGAGSASSGGGSGAAGTGASSSGGGSGGADGDGASSGGGCGCALAGAPASLGLTGLASALGLLAALRGRRRRR